MLEICMTLVKKTVKKTVKLVYLKYSTCGTGPFLCLQKKIYSYLARRTTECWRRGIIEWLWPGLSIICIWEPLLETVVPWTLSYKGRGIQYL